MEFRKLLGGLSFFVREHWKIVLAELILLLMYFFLIYCISGIEGIKTFLLSPEFITMLLIAVAAIYSWLDSKKTSDFTQDLELLQKIDDTFERSLRQGEAREVSIKLVEFTQKLKEQFEYDDKRFEYSGGRPDREFLSLYYDFVVEKINVDTNAEVDDDNYRTSESDQSENGFNTISNNREPSTVRRLKEYVSLYFSSDGNTISIGRIRYSKNYESDSEKDGLKWSTWYSLKLDYIKKLGDEEIQYFVTEDRENTIVFSILGKNLRKMISGTNENPPRMRNLKGNRVVYDFFFGEDKAGNIVEGRPPRRLSEEMVTKVKKRREEN